jgi:hypothetical protein
MAVDLSALSSATTSAQALSNLILVTPQEQVGIQPQPKGDVDGQSVEQPKKFLFNYEGEQQINLQSDITDHFVEDNTAIQDQIALRPETVTTNGFIGELNNVVPPELKPLRLAADKLTPLTAYIPELSTTAELVYANAFQLYQTAKVAAAGAVQAWNSISGGGGQPQTKQAQAFQEFYGYWKDRTLFTVQTPWAVFKDMSILTLRALQPDDSNSYSEFQVTFKAIRFAETFSVSEGNLYDYNQFQGRAFNQGSPEINKGVQTPVEAEPLSGFLPA